MESESGKVEAYIQKHQLQTLFTDLVHSLIKT